MNVRALVLVSLAAGSAAAQDYYFDFGFRPTDQNGDFFTPGGWNNIDYFTSFYFDLVDTEGNAAGLTLEWAGFYDSGSNTLGSENPSGEAAFLPVTATDDFLFGHDDGWAGRDGESVATLTITGLDASASYDFGFFGSRSGTGDVRSARFDVEGANSGSAEQDARGNDTDIADVLGISPTANGEITITIQKAESNTNGSGFWYINALTIETVPSPTAAAVLGLAGAMAGARRRR